MTLLSNPAFGPRVALVYVTLGSLIDVWTAVYYFSYARGEELPPNARFWLTGLFLTGLTLIVLGLVLGPLGRAARKAELPPSEVPRAEAAINQTAAANPTPVVPGQMPSPAPSLAVPGGTAPPPGPLPGGAVPA